MTTIFVNNIKNNQGGNNVKVNQLSGIDTAGSISVQGEGTATTNLQQGVAKSWCNLNGQSTAAIQDSFNTTSMSDAGTGLYDTTFTNNMSDANYSVSGTLANNAPIASNRDDLHQAVAESSSQINLNNFRDGSGQTDAVHMYGQVFGDLA